jgi:hypothetical protein
MKSILILTSERREREREREKRVTVVIIFVGFAGEECYRKASQ